MLCVFVCVAQVLEEDKEHGPLVTVCHVLQEEISLDSTGWTRRYEDKTNYTNYNCWFRPTSNHKLSPTY